MNLKNLRSRIDDFALKFVRKSKYKRKRKDHFTRELLIEGLAIVIAGISAMLVYNNVMLGKEVEELKEELKEEYCKMQEQADLYEIQVNLLKQETQEKNVVVDDLKRKNEAKTKENEELKEKAEGLEKEVEELKKKNVNTMNTTNTNNKSGVYNTNDLGIDTSKKTYMDYRCISKGSKQGSIVYGDEAWTDEDGLRRWGSRYCVAMGRK